MQLEELLNQYNYEFPDELIANSPASPRDSAHLLVFNRQTEQTQFDTFKNLAQYLPKNSVLVLNETKVIPARFYATKPSGGKVELLYLNNDGECISVLSKKPLEINSELQTEDGNIFTVTEKLEKGYSLKPNFTIPEFLNWLENYGETPTPPYIKNIPLSKNKLKEEYQTVFAKTPGSSAAPTASLHFTEELLKNLEQQGIIIEKILLHVGLGTFAPLTEKQIENKKLHEEYFEIPADTAQRLNTYKKENRPIIAVGTTVVRTLESASSKPDELTNLNGQTSLFIQEGYNFKFINGIITNFHVPKSSLLMLVSAFAGREKTLDLYKQAINKKYRLFSFGDGMLIL